MASMMIKCKFLVSLAVVFFVVLRITPHSCANPEQTTIGEAPTTVRFAAVYQKYCSWDILWLLHCSHLYLSNFKMPVAGVDASLCLM